MMYFFFSYSFIFSPQIPIMIVSILQSTFILFLYYYNYYYFVPSAIR